MKLPQEQATDYAQQFKTSASSEGLENIANDWLAGYNAAKKESEGEYATLCRKLYEIALDALNKKQKLPC